MEEGRGSKREGGRRNEGVRAAAGGVIEKGFDSPCAPPMKITTLSYGHSAIFASEVVWTKGE